jgi:hypothetical protein
MGIGRGGVLRATAVFDPFRTLSVSWQTGRGQWKADMPGRCEKISAITHCAGVTFSEALLEWDMTRSMPDR